MLEAFRDVIQRLESHHVDYMVVGSVASIIYGEPRLTRDMDIVIELPPALSTQLDKVFPSSDFYLPPLEIVSQEVMNRGQFNIIDLKTSLKIDFILRRVSPHAITEFGRRRRHPFLPGLEVWLASPEDVIIKKLAYFQEGGSEK